MWLLSFIPDAWLYTTVLILLFGGIAIYIIGEVCGCIPPLFAAKIPMKILGVLVFIVGVYCYGGYATEHEWRQRAAELQVKLDQAAQESLDINKRLSAEQQKKQQVITDKQIVYRTRIKEISKRIDQACVLDPEVPKLLNDAATNPFTQPTVKPQ